MSFFSTIHLAKNALFTSQLGIQVAANNIANADNEGYVREKLVLSSGPVNAIGNLVTGGGVKAEGVVRQVDAYLQKRLWSAAGDMAGGETLESIHISLESAIGELTENDLSTSLTSFFNSIHDVLNQPEDQAVRNLAILQGDQLATEFRRLDGRVRELQETANSRVVSAVGEVNDLVSEIDKLNAQIVDTEKGGTILSDAVGLRDRRDVALEKLAGLIDIQVSEQESGGVNLFVAGDYLVFNGETQLVNVVPGTDSGMATTELRLSRTDGQLRITSGKLAALVTARDEVLSGFLGDLNRFAETLIFEFNKIHASGQGMVGYREILSEHGVDDQTAALDHAGLDFAPVHGSFRVDVRDMDTGAFATHDLSIQLNGLDDDTSLQDLANSLDAIEGLSAQINMHGQLQIRSESPATEFAFGEDTSGVLAALGINAFFSGTGANDISVHNSLLGDNRKLAISLGGVGQDSRNGERMAAFLSTPLEARDGSSLATVYETWMGEVSQASSLSASVAEGLRVFHATLEGEHLALSGVSLDEEAISLMTYQRSYQASARVITTINQLLDVLVNL